MRSSRSIGCLDFVESSKSLNMMSKKIKFNLRPLKCRTVYFQSYIYKFDMTDNAIMDSSKRQELDTMNKDRISDLPDCLIHHIFKSVPLTNIVQTCVLSKRWETLWTDIKCLDFCDLGDNINFEYFVDSVLLLRNPLDVDTFRLELPLHFDQDIANVWIDYAVDHNVRVLEYKLPQRPFNTHEYKVSQHLFTCQSLEALRVAGCCDVIIDFPVLISLERLKKLQLYRLEFSDEDLKNMISGCPSIETLYMEACLVSYGTGSEEVDICSQTMKNLIIEQELRTTLRFCTPNLVWLYYETDCVDGVGFIDMPYLEEATISDEFGAFNIPGDIDVPALIRPFANARNLKLCGPWIESISKEEVMKFPMFVKLKSLLMSKRCMHDFEAICCFLRRAPNVDNLALVRSHSDDDHCSCGMTQNLRNCDFCDQNGNKYRVDKICEDYMYYTKLASINSN